MILFPYSISKIDFRSNISVGLNISANQASPAFAAFQDSREHYRTELPKFPDRFEPLMSGQKYQIPESQVVPRIRTLAMRGLTIRNHAYDPQPFYVGGHMMARAPQVYAQISRPNINASSADLTLHDRKKLLAAQLEQEDWNIPTAASQARALAEEELVSRGQKIIRSATGTTITIGKPSASNPYARTGDPFPAPKAPEEKDFEVARQDPPAFAGLSTVHPAADQMRPLWLSGHIEMTGGLAFMGAQTTLSIRRKYDGQVLEKGRVWVTEGKFEIHVKKAVGTLVAELVTNEGQILGRGELNLLQLKEIPHRENRINNIRIAMQPIAQGATFRAVSGYSHGQQMMPVRDARVEVQNFSDAQKVNDEGYASEPSFTPESSFVARAVAKKHWSSLVVGVANHPQDLRLFSNSMIDALIGLELNGTDRKEAYQNAIVWGQITEKGQNKAGVIVEMAGNYRPIYFNEAYIPDEKLTATSSNGMFAFLRVKQGVQALRVKSNNKVYPAQIFPTENKHVSYVAIEIADKRVTQFRVMDVLDMGKQVSARIRLIGTDKVTDVTGTNYVEYDAAANPIMVEAEAGVEYEISRSTMTGNPQTMNIPLIRRDWLNEIYAQRKTMAFPGRGTVVGFVDGQDFELEMTGYPATEAPQIVFFDAEGKVINGRNGIAGGGFIIFNAPVGLQTVYIHPTQSRESYSQVVVAEPDFVHVMTYSASR